MRCFRYFALPRLLPFVLLALVACGTPDKAATPTQYADDAGVTARVRMALIQHPVWREANLQVSTQSGVVRITGNLPPEQNAQNLEALITQIDGVRDIRNDAR